MSGWAPGEIVLDLYEIVGVAGRGGMGTVHRVHHREWGIDLAVKSPLPGAAEAKTLEREAEIWIDLGLHPHVCACHYVRRIDDQPRIFAEFVAGGSLSDAIAGGTLYGRGSEPLLDVAIGFADGLAHAHDEGVVHQDVKPANVLLDADGAAKVTDFGIARAGRPFGRAIAGPQVSVGGMTPAYRSPEQAAGARLTAATDVWSFAVSVLELYMGQLPSPEGMAAPQVLDAFVSRGSADPAIPAMPPGIVALLGRCLARDPELRPAIAEAAEALRAAFAEEVGRPHHERPAGKARLAAGELSNRALSMLDLGREPAAEHCWREAVRADPHHPEATYNLGLRQWRQGAIADDELVRRLEAMRASHEADWRDEYLLALVHMERGDRDAAQQLLDPLPSSEPEVIAARAALPPELFAERRALGGHTQGIGGVAVAAAGGELVVVSGDGAGRVILTEGDRAGVELEPAAHAGSVRSAAITPDGRFAATGDSDGTAVVWDLGYRTVMRQLSGHDGIVRVALASDAKLALTGARDGVRLWDLATGVPLTLDELGADAVALSAGGELAVAALGGRLTCWYAPAGAPADPGRAGRLEGHDEEIESLAMTPDGGRIVAGGASKLFVWDRLGEGRVRGLAGHTARVWSVAVSADGRTALTAALDRTHRLWDLDAGRCLRTYSGGEKPALAVALDATGSVAVVGGTSGALHRCLVRRPPRSPWAYSRPRRALDAVAAEQALVAALEEVAELERAFDLHLAAARLRELRSVTAWSRDARVVECWRRIGDWGRRRTATAAYRSDDPGEVVEGVGLRHWGTRGGRFVAVARGNGNAMAVRRPASRIVVPGFTRAELWQWEGDDPRTCRRVGELAAGCHAATVSADGRLGLTGGDDGVARLWDLDTARCIRTLSGHGKISAVALSADADVALVGDADGSTRLWDVEGAAELDALRDHSSYGVTAVALSSDGDQVVTAGWDGAGCWRRSTRQRTMIDTGKVMAVAVTADGRHVLVGERDGTCGLHDAADGRLLLSMSQPDGVSAVALTPAGDFALTLGARGGATVWTVDWDFDFSSDIDWDGQMRPVIEAFLRTRVPYAEPLAPDGPIRTGRPDAANIDELFNHHLQATGLGWPAWLWMEDVRDEVDDLIAHWPAEAATP